MYNQAILVGRITQEPKYQVIGKRDGSSFAKLSFNIAVDDSYQDNQGTWHNESNFFLLQLTGPLATSIYEKGTLKVGSTYLFNCKLKARQYEKDGQRHYPIDFLVQNFKFICDSKKAILAEAGIQQQPQNPQYQPNQVPGYNGNQYQSQGYPNQPQPPQYPNNPGYYGQPQNPQTNQFPNTNYNNGQTQMTENVAPWDTYTNPDNPF